MRYRMLDVDGDYSFGRGQQNITYGVHAVSQAIKTRLLLLKSEWWENTEEGLPLFDDILAQPGGMENIIIVDSIIKERIINTPNVVSIKDFESIFENRAYTFSCTAETKYGDAELALTF